MRKPKPIIHSVQKIVFTIRLFGFELTLARILDRPME